MRRGLLCFIAVAVLLAAACEKKPFPGVTYDFRTTITGDTKLRDIRGHASVAGNFMSVEFETGDGVLTHERSIYISEDGGESYVVVLPEKKSYYEVSGDETSDRLSKVLSMAAEKLNLRIYNARSRVVESRGRQEIDDYPTTRYDYNLSYDLTMSVGPQSIAATTDVKTKIWTTDRFSERYFDFLRKQQAKSGFREIDERVANDMKKVRGFPLKQVVETTVVANQMRQRSRAEMRVTNIRHVDIPAATFEVPDGYEKIDPPAVDLKGLLEMQQPPG